MSLGHFDSWLFRFVLQVSSPGKALNLYPSNEYEVLPNGCEAHWEVVERILFIYAKLNPGIAYVQGMNEIVGPIYYTFATDPNSQWKGNAIFFSAQEFTWENRRVICVDFAHVEHAEADTFFCFTNLMSENRDNFIKSLDDSQCGITFKMESVFSKLKEKDTELYMKLVKNKSTLQFTPCVSKLSRALNFCLSVCLSISKSRTSSLSISPSAGWRCCSLKSFCCQMSSGFGIRCFQNRIALSFSSPSAVPCWCTSADSHLTHISITIHFSLVDCLFVLVFADWFGISCCLETSQRTWDYCR